jgi:parvulin-like peptidyl-prolyl isomerase
VGARGPQRLALVLFGVLFIGLFVIFGISEGIGHPSVPEGDVALVEDAPADLGHISEAELKRAIIQQAAAGTPKKVPKEGSKKYEELKEAALGELIDTAWISGEAAERGIEVTDKQVATELETIKEQNFKTDAAFEQFLKQSKFTPEDVDKRVRLQLLSTKIQEFITSTAAPASKSEVADYYEAAKAEQFTTKESRDIRIIVNKDKTKVDEAKKALEADQTAANWKKVAKEFSEDPTTSANGGEQKAITEELLATAGPLKGAIFDSATGELKGPIKFQGNYSLVEVIKLNPEKVQELAEVRSQIAQQLTQQLQEKVFQEFVTKYQSKWEARTFCAAGFEVERCSNFKGDGHPASAPPGCYEENPKLGKGQAALECPAPVVQNQPAIPGSVDLLKPEGERLVQRPRPVGLKEGAAAEAGALPEGVEEAPAPSGE